MQVARLLDPRTHSAVKSASFGAPSSLNGICPSAISDAVCLNRAPFGGTLQGIGKLLRQAARAPERLRWRGAAAAYLPRAPSRCYTPRPLACGSRRHEISAGSDGGAGRLACRETVRESREEPVWLAPRPNAATGAAFAE